MKHNEPVTVTIPGLGSVRVDQESGHLDLRASVKPQGEIAQALEHRELRLNAKVKLPKHQAARAVASGLATFLGVIAASRR